MTEDIVICWRITRSKYGTRSDAFNGKGAVLFPGRWNKAGVPVIYSCSSIALCALETLVHIKSRSAISDRFVLFEVHVPKELISRVTLPAGRLARTKTQEIGDQWVKQATYAVLQVPSTITGEANYVLNPRHPAFSKIVIKRPKAFKFDMAGFFQKSGIKVGMIRLPNRRRQEQPYSFAEAVHVLLVRRKILRFAGFKPLKKVTTKIVARGSTCGVVAGKNLIKRLA
ncbi:MAG: RES family NAD+ phosphorylase [Verrucomicrobia bacterium]|nr:RES family NAD+ phosphorylase [Verrucomicrobiota bacterium]